MTSPRSQPWLPGQGLATVAGHATVTCPGRKKREAAQAHRVSLETGLTLQPLAEILFLKVDTTTTVLEFSTREFCLEILRDGGVSPGVCLLPSAPHTRG